MNEDSSAPIMKVCSVKILSRIGWVRVKKLTGSSSDDGIY
jgi:hypothetical protein